MRSDQLSYAPGQLSVEDYTRTRIGMQANNYPISWSAFHLIITPAGAHCGLINMTPGTFEKEVQLIEIHPEALMNKLFPYRKTLFRIASAVFLCVILSTLFLSSAQAKPSAMWQGNCKLLHSVEKGESLGEIAAMYGVNKQDLADTNFITGSTHLDSEEILCIPYTLVEVDCPTPLFSGMTANHKKLFIWGSYLPQGHSFSVWLRQVNEGPYQQVGSAQVDQDGNLSGTYKVPTNLRKVETFDVCLRSKKFGYYTCTTVVNY